MYNPETLPAAKWAHPEKAVIHIFQAMYWGNLQFRLRGCDPERHALWFGEGGTQMGAKWYENPCEIDENSRFFIENVFEELDAPGEWFFDEEARWLYYYPQESLDLKTALFEVSQLESVLVFRGTQKAPVTHISIRDVRITHTEKTFL